MVYRLVNHNAPDKVFALFSELPYIRRTQDWQVFQYDPEQVYASANQRGTRTNPWKI